jgi:outer membrane protein assembly factor BamD (BamD/ComL family)
LSTALEPFLSAAPGTLRREDISRLRRGSDKTLAVPMPTAGAKDVEDDTEAKALAFEQSLLADVRAREAKGDGEGLQRLSEGHPRGSAVGDAARAALSHLLQAQQREHEEEEAFQRAWEDGRAAVWRAFITAHPGSARVDRARQLLDEAIAFESASTTESETAIRQFLGVHPDGRHHLEAEIRLVTIRQRAASEAFTQAKAVGTQEAIREFLARYAGSPHAEEARQILAERAAFETASNVDSEEAWDGFLKKFPNAGRVDEARVRRERASAREEDAYARAAKEKTATAWNAFLERHPRGERGTRAERNRAEAIAFEEARKQGRAALQDFVRTHPEGLLLKDAQRAMRQLAETDQLDHAQRLDTAAAWRLYLMMHPSGAHAADAHTRLTALEADAFARIVATKDAKGVAAFLIDFPDSSRRDELARITASWQDESEPHDFDEAWEAGSTAAWDRYLRDHSASARVAEARRCRQEAADFEQAVAANLPPMWRAFLKTWPEGRHRMDAALRVKGK